MPAMAFVNAALGLGKRVPEDFCVVAYDGTYVVDMNGKNMTTIVQPIEKIADAVVETMTGLVEKRETGSVNLRIPVSLRQGNTTK